MNIMGLWDSLVDAICRPPRDAYHIEQLLGGSKGKFTLGRKLILREDLILKNLEGMRMKCSHYYHEKFVKQKINVPVVIYCHCNSGSRRDAEEALHQLLPHDITVFCLDFTGSGLSDGDWVTLGCREVNDLEVCVKYLREKYTKCTIGLWGRSMGAVTALLYSRRDPSIAGIVSDSAFCRLTDLMVELAAEQNLPIPKYLMRLAINIMCKSVRKRAGFDIESVAPLDVVHESYIPALFGFATEDNFVRPHHSKLLHDAYAGESRYTSFSGDHNSIRPYHFYDEVVRFFQTVFENAVEKDPELRENGIVERNIEGDYHGQKFKHDEAHAVKLPRNNNVISRRTKSSVQPHLTYHTTSKIGSDSKMYKSSSAAQFECNKSESKPKWTDVSAWPKTSLDLGDEFKRKHFPKEERVIEVNSAKAKLNNSKSYAQTVASASALSKGHTCYSASALNSKDELFGAKSNQNAYHRFVCDESICQNNQSPCTPVCIPSDSARELNSDSEVDLAHAFALSIETSPETLQNLSQDVQILAQEGYLDLKRWKEVSIEYAFNRFLSIERICLILTMTVHENNLATTGLLLFRECENIILEAVIKKSIHEGLSDSVSQIAIKNPEAMEFLSKDGERMRNDIKKKVNSKSQWNLLRRSYQNSKNLCGSLSKWRASSARPKE